MEVHSYRTGTCIVSYWYYTDYPTPHEGELSMDSPLTEEKSRCISKHSSIADTAECL